jgi:hypothetical protein
VRDWEAFTHTDLKKRMNAMCVPEPTDACLVCSNSHSPRPKSQAVATEERCHV